MQVVFGIDIGGTTIKIGLFSLKKKLLLTEVLKTNKKEKGKYILKDLSLKIKKIIKDNNLKEEDVLGIGFGIPGPVVDNFVIRCPNIGWTNLYLEEEFLKELGFKTFIIATNDATAAAYGEYSYLKEEKSLAFITLGTGVGGGLILNGKLIEGTHGSAGEFGHLQVEYDNPQKCSCGLYGCLETTASIRGVRWVAKNILDNNTLDTKLKSNSLSPRTIFDLAKKGDLVANKIVAKVGDYIARASAKIAACVDPEVIIIGGGISHAGPILTKAIEKSYKKYTYFGTKDVKFRLAKLRNDSGMYGASELIFGKLQNENN